MQSPPCFAPEWTLSAADLLHLRSHQGLPSQFEMVVELRDVVGFRGEKLVELRLTDYSEFERPLFRPGFLGDKWPAIDFYVELNAVRGKRPYFFAQVKATSSSLTAESTHLTLSSKKADIDRLLRIPGPTYIFGVHEPSNRVFVRSIHAGVPVRAVTRIPVAYELTSTNLEVLHREVREFWSANDHKPAASVFS
jgi:hypothetical protein